MRGTWKGLMSVVIVPDEEEDERYLKGFGECGKMCQRRRRRMRGTWKGLVSVVIVPAEEEDPLRCSVPSRGPQERGTSSLLLLLLYYLSLNFFV
jgi:hypothetical protein